MPILLWILGLGFMVFGVCNSFSGLGLFQTLLILSGAVLIVLGRAYKKKSGAFEKEKTRRLFKNMVIAALAVLSAVTCIIYAYPGFSDAPSTGPQTLVVPGCQIRGDRPSQMLARRLNRALEYLRTNPDSVAVLSGGVGDGLSISEAEVMKKYLTQAGIAPERCFLEPDSRNTEQNLEFSARVIAENNLPSDVIIVTDSFHELRSHLYANRAGIENSVPLSVKTPLYVLPYYTLREIPALFVALVRLVF